MERLECPRCEEELDSRSILIDGIDYVVRYCGQGYCGLYKTEAVRYCVD